MRWQPHLSTWQISQAICHEIRLLKEASHSCQFGRVLGAIRSTRRGITTNVQSVEARPFVETLLLRSLVQSLLSLLAQLCRLRPVGRSFVQVVGPHASAHQNSAQTVASNISRSLIAQPAVKQ